VQQQGKHSLASKAGGSTIPDGDTEALDALRKVSEESMKTVLHILALVQKSKEKGFPMDSDSMTQAPFDLLADFFRGSKGIMLDMYRRPEVVLKACEKVLPSPIKSGTGLGCIDQFISF
jgi:hypothetical protein